MVLACRATAREKSCAPRSGHHSHTAAARKLGLTDQQLGEMLEVIALFNATNTLADAYQVRPDVFPLT